LTADEKLQIHLDDLLDKLTEKRSESS
jgi:hypothetical protein